MSDQRLQRYALVAEITGGIGVLVTLIFLVIQIGENTQALKRNSYESILDSLVEWRTTWLVDPELRRIMYVTGNSDEILEGEDRYTQFQLKNSIYQIYERAYWANEYDQMGESEWQRFANSICHGKSQFWEGTTSWFSTEFVEFVEACDPNIKYTRPVPIDIQH
jgi:hypothetical protein